MRTSTTIATIKTALEIDWKSTATGELGRSKEDGAEGLVFRIRKCGRNQLTGMVDMELVILDGAEELYRNRVGTSPTSSLSWAKAIISEAGLYCARRRPRNQIPTRPDQQTGSAPLTKAALEGVRIKLLNSIFWNDRLPRTPEAFALHAAEVLDREDFRVLDEFEALLGERVACLWLDDAISEAGYAEKQAA
jgi:hypothetical protein